MVKRARNPLAVVPDFEDVETGDKIWAVFDR
jgi:hypothetical protein